MHFLYWIDRHAGIYRAFSALLVLLVLLLVASQVNSDIEADMDIPLAEALATYTSTLESGTVSSRAMGAAILFGLENREAKQLALGKLPPDAPQVLSALKILRTLYFSDLAFLVNRQGVIAAYSSLDKTHGTGLDLAFRPYVQQAMQGMPSVYPAVGSLTSERGIFLAAPVRAKLDITSEPIGTAVIKVGAEKLDALLQSWAGGPAVLVSPQGLVFAASREDWLFHITGEVDKERLDEIRRIRQFGEMFDRTQPPSLPFSVETQETSIDGMRYVVRSGLLEWDDPAGDWKLVLLDKRDPWWSHWSVLGLASLAGLVMVLALFWLYSMARNAVLQQESHRELSIAAATFESREGVMITDTNKVILKVNHAFTDITGYTSEEAVGKTPVMLASGRQGVEFYSRMWESIEHEKSWRGEIWNKRKNGEIYPEQLTITPIFGVTGQLVNYVGIFSDITQRKATEDEIHNLAFYDPLTRLPNRRLLNERLGHAMAASKRDGRYGALMFLDMDNFKQLNDTHGHAMGDLLLMEVAHRITRCVREVDTVARFGGDEFVVMLSELDVDRTESAAQAGIVAEKIRAMLAEPYGLTLKHNGLSAITVKHHCSSSIGVVLFVGNSASPEEIFKWADIAMYQAKSDGRNLIRFFNPQSANIKLES